MKLYIILYGKKFELNKNNCLYIKISIINILDFSFHMTKR